MSLYKTFQTSQDLEKNGIELQYGENDKGQEIIIRVARAGGANNAYNKRLEALVKPYRRQISSETIDNKVLEKLILQAFAETVVLGWSGVEDAEGNALECTVENVIKLFTDLPDLFKDVQDQAQKSVLFRQDILELEAKN